MRRKILRLAKRFIRAFIPANKAGNRVWRREVGRKGITRAYYG